MSKKSEFVLMEPNEFKRMVERIQQPICSDEAFYGFYVHFRFFVYYIAISFLHNEHDAIDISQRVFTTLWEKPLDPTKPEDEWRKWIYTITFNNSASMLRSQKNRKKHEYIIAKQSSESEADFKTTEDDIEAEQKIALMLAINLLPINLKELVIAHYFEGIKIDDMSERFDIPRGTVASRMHRARLELAWLIGNPQEVPANL